ncbi:MAG: two-component regulator propeller domain-containing protein, partial [Saprospiraceae bacterium]
MKLFFLFSICFIQILLPCYGQGDLRIGQWSTHLPYNIGSTVTQSPTRVYYGTEFALLSILKSDTSKVEFFSKVDGLSDVEPSWIRYHNALKTLIVGYKDGNIDLLDTAGISNVNDILRNSSIQGNKEIKNIYTDDSPFAYLCTPFGLVILDLVTHQFRSTVFTNSVVNGFTIFQNKYYLSTDNGLYRYDPSSGNIIENFGQWEKISIPGHPAAYNSSAVAVFHNQLYFGADGDLIRLDHLDSTWYHLTNYAVSFISPEGQSMMVGFRCVNECVGKVLFFRDDSYWHESGVFCNARPTYAIEDEKGRVWYADMFPDIRVAQNTFTPCDLLHFDSPYSGNVSEMEVKDGILYVATGGVSESYNPLGNKDGFFSFDRISWTTYNQFNNPELAATGLENFFRILPHPTEHKLYVGSYYGGLLEYDFEHFKVYNDQNSSLQGAVGDESRERISGLVFDDQNNLWLTNYLAPRPLSVLKADGTWKSFDFPCTTITNVSQVVIDQRGYKWIMLYSKSAGIIVYDDGGTIDDESNDRCIQLGSSNTAIPSNSVNCLAVDLDGDIWVGTAEGPVVFDGGADIFDGHEGSRIKVEQDGVLNYLLGEETIYTIAVDGANRKWFGTGSGVFVQSPAGNEQVASYTTSNSPLLNNRTIDIAIDQNNGIVYIATVGGIMSVRTDAVSGGPIHSDDVYAWPNPVRPDYDGV